MKIKLEIPIFKWKVASKSEHGAFHIVEYYPDGSMFCSCPAGTLGKNRVKACRHCRLIQEQIINLIKKHMSDPIKLKLNEREIRFKGRFPIKDDLDPMKDYTFSVKGQRIETVKHDNDDGTFDIRYVVGINNVEIIEDENNTS